MREDVRLRSIGFSEKLAEVGFEDFFEDREVVFGKGIAVLQKRMRYGAHIEYFGGSRLGCYHGECA